MLKFFYIFAKMGIFLKNGSIYCKKGGHMVI